VKYVNENINALFFSHTISARDSLYSYFKGSEMADTYLITPHGPEFMVIHKAGVAIGVYSTQQEAQMTMEDCERDDFMLRTARSLECRCRSTHAIAQYRPPSGMRLD
jgi:hypothetical protein